MVISLMRLLEAHLDEFRPDAPAAPPPGAAAVKELSEAQIGSLLQVGPQPTHTQTHTICAVTAGPLGRFCAARAVPCLWHVLAGACRTDEASPG